MPAGDRKRVGPALRGGDGYMGRDRRMKGHLK
jgi:hypothetical protein